MVLLALVLRSFTPIINIKLPCSVVSFYNQYAVSIHNMYFLPKFWANTVAIHLKLDSKSNSSLEISTYTKYNHSYYNVSFNLLTYRVMMGRLCQVQSSLSKQKECLSGFYPTTLFKQLLKHRFSFTSSKSLSEIHDSSVLLSLEVYGQN